APAAEPGDRLRTLAQATGLNTVTQGVSAASPPWHLDLLLPPTVGYNTCMTTVSLHDLQQNPAALLDRVEAGERLLVSRGGRPVAELRPLAPPAHGPRPFGLAAGAFAVPDDFDAPLPDD